MMTQFTSPLDNVRIAAPCTADWEEMTGDERVRFCGQCSLNVYNLSSMSKAEAEQIISHAEGRLCVRFYRRADGTILTNNCPVGLRALKRRVSRALTATFSTLLGFFAGLGVYAGIGEKSPPVSYRTMGVMAVSPAKPVVENRPRVEVAGGYEEGQVEVGRYYVPNQKAAAKKVKKSGP